MDINVITESVERLHEVFGNPTLEVERKKIESKLEAAEYNTGDVRSLADCILALLLAAKGRGFSVNAVFDELTKAAKETHARHSKKMPSNTDPAT